MTPEQFKELFTDWYNLKGEPIESLEEMSACRANSRLKKTILTDGKVVSTVWLGLDHSFNRADKLIFETMVFTDDENYQDIDCDRYSTKKDALRGHEVMIAKHETKNQS